MLLRSSLLLLTLLPLTTGRILGKAVSDGTVRGPKKRLGSGFLQNYAIFEDGTPKEYGIEFDASLMETVTTNFPIDGPGSDGRYDIFSEDGTLIWPCCGWERELKSFDKIQNEDVPFSHFVANYNPAGHGPPGIYSVPHFDLHWYTITKQERLSVETPATWEETCGEVRGIWYPIPVTCEDFDRLLMDVPADQLPPNHCTPPNGATEPAMGNHM